ncbi:hypothetical protein AMATHDRAFT_37800 [Amanita thiersii Skay4041]|uniref:Uncharacterized protein n=1 Tax=Amanita thiersii Skay4041 TaxID=703135 RepID=A0A2A9NWA4_9AGAR|nr:hypothetical protein AMATHDRAFT_37800 [Amanita thiersii Skay4041]
MEFQFNNPFSLRRRISFKKTNSPAFESVALFPWTEESIRTIWNGDLVSDDYVQQWNALISVYGDAVAIAHKSAVYIYHVLKGGNLVRFELPSIKSSLKTVPSDGVRIAWALPPATPLSPLVLVTALNVVYILNVKEAKPIGYLTGHGGVITSVVVHPVNPHIFATTSRDFTTRIYDLTHPAHDEHISQYNSCWPLNPKPSKASAPHGLHMNEKEGIGLGRCIILLMGGRTAGHAEAVLGAAFHHTKPLIATCGMDRTVKIWALPPSIDPKRLHREDKPLFSTDRMHDSRVLSVNWLSEDVLISHSAPAVMRVDSNSYDTYEEPGQVILWRWLALGRFFPPDIDPKVMTRQHLRPMASDFQNSSSFKILSVKYLPIQNKVSTVSPTLKTYMVHLQMPRPGCFAMVVYPNSDSIALMHIPLHFKPHKRQKCPFLPEDLNEDMGINADNEDRSEVGFGPSKTQKEGSNEYDKDVDLGWTLGTRSDSAKLTTCSMGLKGQLVVGVGTEETLWVWMLDT